MTDRLLRMSQVEDMAGFKKTFIYKKIAAGEFPPPIKAGSCSRWRESEINTWIDQFSKGAVN